MKALSPWNTVIKISFFPGPRLPGMHFPGRIITALLNNAAIRLAQRIGELHFKTQPCSHYFCCLDRAGNGAGIDRRDRAAALLKIAKHLSGLGAP